MIEQKIKELLEPKFQEEEFQDVFIVEIKHNLTNNKLEVFVDADGELSFRTCQRLSRYLEGYIDEKGWLGEKYTIEVSSPGITKPLKLNRQYVKNIGRTVKVSFIGHGGKEGLLKAVDEEKITIEEEVIIKDKKKKRKELVDVEIPFDDIAKTVVQIAFK
ncbi:MAG: ribosome maturation factor RimP [Saprospiraceae bacterium]